MAIFKACGLRLPELPSQPCPGGQSRVDTCPARSMPSHGCWMPVGDREALLRKRRSRGTAKGCDFVQAGSGLPKAGSGASQAERTAVQFWGRGHLEEGACSPRRGGFQPQMHREETRIPNSSPQKICKSANQAAYYCRSRQQQSYQITDQPLISNCAPTFLPHRPDCVSLCVKKSISNYSEIVPSPENISSSSSSWTKNEPVSNKDAGYTFSI